MNQWRYKNDKLQVTLNKDDQRPFIIKASGKSIIRPQITYQIPLSIVPSIFLRLSDLKHKDSSRFLESLTSLDFEFDSKIWYNRILMLTADIEEPREMDDKTLVLQTKGNQIFYFFQKNSLIQKKELKLEQKAIVEILCLFSTDTKELTDHKSISEGVLICGLIREIRPKNQMLKDAIR